MFAIPTSIPSFAANAFTAVFSQLGMIMQELFVVGVFLASYAAWYRLRRSSTYRFKGKASKMPACSAWRKAPPTFPSKASALRTPAPVNEAGEHAACEAPHRSAAGGCRQNIEAQILRHLEQFEFTRALGLFRALDRGDREHRFSEQFYLTFIESAVRVGKLDVIERLLAYLKSDGLVPAPDFWRRLLKAFSLRKCFSSCLTVYSLFQDQLPADKTVWSCLMNAAIQVGDKARLASMLLEYAKVDLLVEDYILFFRAYLVLADVHSAEALFRKLGSRTSPLMLNHLLLTCVNARQPKRGLQLLMEAHCLEEEEHSASIVDTTSYNTVIKGLLQLGSLPCCFECLRTMGARGIQPDDITYTTLLSACIEENNPQAIDEIIKLCLAGNFQAGTVVHTLLIKGLVKVGRLPEALELYKAMRRGASASRPDLITYSVLIKALVDQRDLAQALWLVEDMKSAGHRPDDIIVTHLLDGCRHEGNRALGERIFAESLANGVRPSEYTLVMMLKLYGHVGAHREAYDLVAGWEADHGFKPTVVHFTCLMSGCLRRKQYDQAWAAYELMRAHGVRPDGTLLATLLPGLMAAQRWGRAFSLARDALGAARPDRRLPAEALGNLLAQLQATEGFSAQAAELRELLRAAGLAAGGAAAPPARAPAPGRQPPRRSPPGRGSAGPGAGSGARRQV